MVTGLQPAACGSTAGTTAGNMAAVDAADLAKMKKADMEDLAAKLGVDISKAKNNDERAALIAAVEIQAPAQGTGSAQ